MKVNKMIFKSFTIMALVIFSYRIQASECEKYNITRNKLTNFDFIEEIPEEILSHYQQIGPIKKDVLGDFSLFKKAASTPQKILWTLEKATQKLQEFSALIHAGKACANEIFPLTYNQDNFDIVKLQREVRESDLRIIKKSHFTLEQKALLTYKVLAGEIYIEGEVDPMRRENFAKMIGQIILEEKENGIEPKLGHPHDWSDEFKNSKTASFSIMAKFSKVLIALSRGETSQYMLTGKENEMEKWMLSQPINSLSPHQVIRQSYIINDGDMYSTILTIENVLNRYWRHQNRANLPITIRLKSIINTFGADGDKFGTWYHLFGIMLYGYVEGAFKAKAVGTIEAMGSAVLNHFSEGNQEDLVNIAGGEIGGRVADMIEDKTYLDLKDEPLRLNHYYYLNLLHEDYTDRLEEILENQIKN